MSIITELMKLPAEIRMHESDGGYEAALRIRALGPDPGEHDGLCSEFDIGYYLQPRISDEWNSDDIRVEDRQITYGIECPQWINPYYGNEKRHWLFFIAFNTDDGMLQAIKELRQWVGIYQLYPNALNDCSACFFGDEKKKLTRQLNYATERERGDILKKLAKL